MKFELGKYYQHSSGETIHIVGSVKTYIHGWCYVAEVSGESNLRPVGYTDDGYAQNWTEIGEEDYE